MRFFTSFLLAVLFSYVAAAETSTCDIPHNRLDGWPEKAKRIAVVQLDQWIVADKQTLSDGSLSSFKGCFISRLSSKAGAAEGHQKWLAQYGIDATLRDDLYAFINVFADAQGRVQVFYFNLLSSATRRSDNAEIFVPLPFGAYVPKVENAAVTFESIVHACERAQDFAPCRPWSGSYHSPKHFTNKFADGKLMVFSGTAPGYGELTFAIDTGALARAME